MSLLSNKFFMRVAKRLIEIVCITGVVSILKIFNLLGWSSLALHGLLGPLSIGVCSWALLSVRAGVQSKILTGSFFTSACPTSSKTNAIILATTVATQIAAVVLVAKLLPTLVVIDGLIAYSLVIIFAFAGAVLSNIPNKLLTELAKRS